VQSYLDSIPDAYIGNVEMGYYNQYLLVAFPTVTTNNRILAFYFPTKTWSLFTGGMGLIYTLPTSLGMEVIDDDTGPLYLSAFQWER